MASKKKTRIIINTYNKKAKENIHQLLVEYLEEAGAVECTDALLTCVDELVKNAIKANYKYLIIRKELVQKIFNTEMSPNVRLRMGRDDFEKYASSIVSDGHISAEVREILDQESVYISLSNRAYDENRELAEDEMRKISRLYSYRNIRNEIRSGAITTTLKIERANGHLVITVSNTAPILSQDLQRIEQKRNEYLHYQAAGREHEFFVNNIDTSESGFGLGYAVIISSLIGMGLDVNDVLSIEPDELTTVRLTLPVGSMQRSLSREVELMPAV